MWQRQHAFKKYTQIINLENICHPYDLEGANINIKRYEVFLIFNLSALSILLFHNPHVNQLESY